MVNNQKKCFTTLLMTKGVAITTLEDRAEYYCLVTIAIDLSVSKCLEKTHRVAS